MKRFLQEVVWRLSLVAALLTCTALAAWGQEPENPDEGTTEKVMHPVYINLQGNDIDINGPTEVVDGEDFQFEIVGGEGGSSLSVYQDGQSANIEPDGNVITVKNVTGTILISVSQAYYFTVDGVRYRTYVGSLDAFADGDNAVEVAPSSSVELKNYVEYEGVLYWVQSYYGCYNRFDNITSLTLPNTSMFYSSNTMNTLNGLKELHVKALSPDKYPMINDAFGDKDLTGVTLYVPEGCSGNYTGEPWSRFGSIKEEEAPTEFPIYMVGPGVADYSPQTAQKGEDLTVTFTLESGYYSMLGDQRVNVVASNRTYKDDQFTYVLWDEMSTAGIIATSLPADTEELFIPAYVTNSDGNTYRVSNIVDSPFANLTQLKKLTIEGGTDLSFSAFTVCASLAEIHCLSEQPRMAYSSSFNDAVRNSCVVYVPEGCVETYKNQSPWGSIFPTIVEEGTQLVEPIISIGNDFDHAYLQVTGLDVSLSDGNAEIISYQVKEGAQADVLLRYTIQNYEQWKDHAKIYYGFGGILSGSLGTPAEISPDGAFDIRVSKDLFGDYNWFNTYLQIYVDQPGELVYDIQAYWSESEELAMELKDNTMIFINPVSFTCDKDTVKGSVGEEIQISITAGEIPSEIAGKEFGIIPQFYIPTEAEGKIHLYGPDGTEFELRNNGGSSDGSSVSMADLDGKAIGTLESNQTYSLTFVSEVGISDPIGIYNLTFRPHAGNRELELADWSVALLIDSTKVIETDSTLTDTELETITIESAQDTQITVNLDGVTSGEVTVSTESDVKLELSGDNDLGDLVNNGTVVIQTSTTTTTDVTLNYNTITNEGTLRDETGLVTSVEGSAALSIEKIPDATVQEGGTVTLTATANVEVNVTVTFQWQRLVDGVWQNVPETEQAAMLLRSAETAPQTDQLVVSAADAGQYRCLITRTEPVEGTDDKEVSTTLTAYATVTVTEAPEPEPEPEPEPDPEPSYYDVTLPEVEGATIKPLGSTSVIEGGTFRFTIEIEEGYIADNLLVRANGPAITPDANGVYSVTVWGDVEIVVTGIEPDPTVGVEDVDDLSLKVWSSEGRLHIRTPKADRAYIVTFGGRVYKIQELPAGETAIPMPRGAYIIYVGGESFKISM